jgi:hypothetical protein
MVLEMQKRNMTQEQTQEIVSDYLGGKTVKEICKKNGFSHEWFRQIINKQPNPDEIRAKARQARHQVTYERWVATRPTESTCAFCGNSFKLDFNNYRINKTCSARCRKGLALKHKDLIDVSGREYYNQRANRYYHSSLKNNPKYIALRNKCNREYAQRTQYYKRPEVKEKIKAYSQRPDVKAKRKAYTNEYYQRPEVKQRRKEYFKKRNNLKKNHDKGILGRLKKFWLG